MSTLFKNMNTSVEGIIVNNCQYAPIYLIQDPGATQANTYVLTPSSVDQPKPVSDNLKTFYENSGNIENGVFTLDAAVRPTVVKKKESVLIGNNLKLASFLMPKNDNIHKQYTVENIVLKPNITTSTSNSVPANTVPANTVPVNTIPVNTVPKIDIDRKIVRLKHVPIINRTRPEKVLPKIKPKENAASPTQSKHTSVQLIKLGETYHSLNHLSEEQIKMVNQALKMFKDPDKTVTEPTYDPVTNTRYIYKVVSPKDLTVVGQKKILLKDKKLTKIPKKIVEEKLLKQMMPIKQVIVEPPEPEPQEQETKVTRSGRKVKLPKQILPEDSPQKYKKKAGTIVSCFQCCAEFSSLYRLQKHYENHPTHIPAKIHSNLFHCLLAIIKSGSDGNKTNIFIQQLEQLIVKLKSLLPCLLKKVEGSDGQPCTINDDVGRLFGMNPGKYNIDVEALNCVKDKNGHCIHNPPKTKQHCNDHKLSTNLISNGDSTNTDNESENCARINSVAKWPTVSKRIWKLKQKTHELSPKKMRLKSEGDTLIDLGTEELIFNDKENPISTAALKTEDNVTDLLDSSQDLNIDCPAIPEPRVHNPAMVESNETNSDYVQFHSAHFDIRSSPIKPSSTVFRKFQINPSKMNGYQVQVLRSLDMVDKDHKQAIRCSDKSIHTTDNNLHFPNPVNGVHVSLPNVDNGLPTTLSNSDSGHLTMPNDNNLDVILQNTDENLNMSLPNSAHELQVTVTNGDNGLHNPLGNTNNSLDISLPNTDTSLHDIFKDDVDLSCKEDSNIDPVLKDWIISTSEKSQQTLTDTNSLMEPAFLHIRDSDSIDKCIDKNGHRSDDMPSLDDTDNRLLSSQGSVLNFLETLGNELVYPETEIRNNGVDFQLDLFTFHNS